jgi:hypothetical protein
MIEKLGGTFSFVGKLVLASAIAVGLYSESVFCAPVPIWAVFNSNNSELPNDSVRSLALGPEN